MTSTRLSALVGMLWFAAWVGCGGAKPENPTPAVENQGPPVQILVLDDPPLAAAIARIWKDRGEGEIDVAERTSKEVIDSPRKVLGADVVVYPAAMMGELAERDLIVPLDAEVRRDPNLAINDFFPAVRLSTLSWDREVMASAFGVPQLVLLYRNDMLEKLNATPPTTWEEYYDLAQKLNDAEALGDLVSDKESWAGACEPGGIWTATLTLAQAACYVGESSSVSMLWELRSMQPKINTPPFQQTLTRMANGEVDRSRTSPQDCFHAILKGECAMAVCWPTGVGVKALDLPKQKLPIHCASLPGARQTFADGEWTTRQPPEQPQRVSLHGVEGRLISVTREAQRHQAASQRLVWLSGKEWGDLVGVASSAAMPCRASSRGLGQWTGGALTSEGLSTWSNLLEQEALQTKAVATIRIRGRGRYLAALVQAFEAVVAGAKAEQALSDAVTTWEKITDELGRESQRASLAMSLGL